MKKVSIKNNVKLRKELRYIPIPNEKSSMEEQLLYNLAIQMLLGVITRCDAEKMDSFLVLSLQYENCLNTYNNKIYLNNSENFKKYFDIIY